MLSFNDLYDITFWKFKKLELIQVDKKIDTSSENLRRRLQML